MLTNLILIVTIFLADPTGLKLGEKAPDFKAINQNGDVFTLYDKLESGPVIVSFYRGAWCRYCMAQMKNYQDSIAYLSDMNVQIVAISPEHEDGIKKTVSISGASFSVVHDERLDIMMDYKVISQEKRNEYLKKLDETGEDNQHKYLPVPATYLIDEQGTVQYVYFDPNYKVRPAISDIIKSLDD